MTSVISAILMKRIELRLNSIAESDYTLKQY